MDLLTQAITSLNNIEVMSNEIENNLAEFKTNLAKFKSEYGIDDIKVIKPVTLKDQQVSLTWAEMMEFNISTASFPHVDNYTHYIKRVVKNVTQENDTLKGVVKMGGKTLVVTKDANFKDDCWDIQGVL